MFQHPYKQGAIELMIGCNVDDVQAVDGGSPLCNKGLQSSSRYFNLIWIGVDAMKLEGRVLFEQPSRLCSDTATDL